MTEAKAVIAGSTLFSAAWCKTRHPDVALSKLSAEEHYLRVGAALGRDPSEHFSTSRYLERYKDVVAREENPLLHYELHGRGEGREPIPVPLSEAADHVDVILPVFDRFDAVEACLTSLKDSINRTKVRVLIVHNASDVETSQWLHSFVSNLEGSSVSFSLVEQDANQGNVNALNAGLSESVGAHIVLLGSSIVATDFWLDGLLRCIKSDTDLGLAGP